MVIFIAPVENVTVAVNCSTSIFVSWNVKHELIGWNLSSQYYSLYYSARSPDGLHSLHRSFEVNRTSMEITINHLILEADWQHQFEVSLVLAIGIEGLEIVENEKAGVALQIATGVS